MKRYASHFLFFPGYGCLSRHVVEMCEGHVVRIFPLTEEIENTEWLPGIIALLSDKDPDLPDFDKCGNKLTTVPADITEKLPSLTAFFFSPFDFTTMRPCAETQRKPLR
ncbi:hypothetical protein [Bacteroides heparinolyticus]|uniref:hypothetical protein n=1 Tax=Prevotella heparinolytica TaxID=28113 RepID=UPI0035A17B3C